MLGRGRQTKRAQCIPTKCAYGCEVFNPCVTTWFWGAFRSPLTEVLFRRVVTNWFGEPSEVLSQRSSLEEWSRIGLGSLQKSSHKDPLYKSGFNGLQPSSFFYVFLFVWCLFCCCRFLLSCLVRGLRRNSRKSIPPSVV